MKLWPRLPLPRARTLVEAFAEKPLEELKNADWRPEATALFAPTGGIKVDPSTLRSLRRQLESIAETAGYPKNVGRESAAQFDDSALELLADFEMPFGEAIRPETWAWITVVLVPHLTKWRWPGTAERLSLERYAGPLVRNSLGRLWYQAFLLDRGRDHPDRWLYAQSFGADQVVALIERPSLGANREICRAVGKYWAGLPQPKRSEELFRQAMKALIMRAGVQRVDALPSELIERIVDESFEVSGKRIDLA